MADLKLGVAMPMVGHGVGAQQFVRELVEEAQAAESSGFTYCLVPEHHDVPANAVADPLTVAGWLLAHTSELLVGTGVMLLPLHHPVHVAEQTGILHAASGGRVVLGLGAGYQQQDFGAFGIDRAQRFAALEEGIATLRAGWRGERINGCRVGPTADRPPEILLGGSGPVALARAARLGDAWLVDPTYPLAMVEPMSRRYEEAAAADAVTPRTIVMRELWVADSDAEAKATYGPVVERVFRYYLKRGALGHLGEIAAEDVTLDGALRDIVVCGSMETVTDRITEIVERTGAEACVFMLRHPDGPSHERVCEVITRLGTELRPAIRRSVSADSA